MGKGDQKSRRGKIWKGSYGVTRSHKTANSVKPAIVETKPIAAKVAPKPIVEKPVAEKAPIAQKPVVEKPVAEKPKTSQKNADVEAPVAEKPVAEHKKNAKAK
jgi:ribosomal small subunit protein bTHX